MLYRLHKILKREEQKINPKAKTLQIIKIKAKSR